MKINLFIACCFFNFCYTQVSGQSGNDSLFDRSMTLEMRNDTLVSGTGLKFFVGQKLTVGSPAGDNGYFRSIIHSRAALVPSIWGQDPRYPYAIENHVNKKKSREKVKQNILPGDSIVITKIGYSKTGKPHFYAASFSAGNEGFYCDIKFALILRELLLQ